MFGATERGRAVLRGPRTRKPVLAIVLALTAVVASAGVVAAVDKGTSVRVIGGPYYFRAYTNFVNNWSIRTVTNGTGLTFYLDKLGATASIEGGRTCVATEVCSSFSFTATAKVTYNGTTIKSYTLPAGSCYSGANSPTSYVMNKCLTGQSFVIKPYYYTSPVKVTFTWSVGAYGGGELPFFIGNAWTATKTVTLWP